MQKVYNTQTFVKYMMASQTISVLPLVPVICYCKLRQRSPNILATPEIDLI